MAQPKNPISTAAVLALVWITTWGAAAARAERAEVVTLEPEELAAGVPLTLEWRYQPGDRAEWADPGLDDSEWPLVRPALRDPQRIPGGWQGIGWFRRRVVLAPEFGEAPLGLFIVQAGASEIFVDGRLAVRFGTVSSSPAQERSMVPQYVESIALEPGVEHVIAVRYSNAMGNALPQDFRGFELTLGELQALTAIGLRGIRQYTAMMSGSIGLFGAFTILHLLLFVFQPRALENLFFVFFSGSIVAMQLFEVRMNSLSDLDQALVAYKWCLTFAISMALSALLLGLRVFKQRIGWPFVLSAAVAAGAVLWLWTRPVWTDMLPVTIVLFLVLLETLRVGLVALLRREPEAWVIGFGLLVLTLTVLLGTMRTFGILAVPWQALLAVGFGTLALSFSVHLTRGVARTNRELALRLDEVEALTARSIEQERWKAQEETERRVLEAEDRRKTAELEEARRLQLAMLPRELPEVEGLDFAVHMSTANEVGGDYYDFSGNGDGSCLLAVGDATGHGLHAGMIVAVAKSLFQTCSDEASLSTVLRRIGAGLRSMRQRLASMAMVLVRLSTDKLQVASAGMPPLLIWRSDSGEIEELLLPSTPLGTIEHTHCDEREITLNAGDTALIMSDGLVEVTSSEGDLFGYQRAGILFAESAHLQPQAIIDRLVARTQEFMGDRPLTDDMTLVVLKARS
ncbi:MAG: SpoIIE family protein phosphatase [bacterium]|nr:SpoIIE family protein phosphatase [bacterium]